jgi:membrane-bound acyltransferase YfiQ involved in biofilm formation
MKIPKIVNIIVLLLLSTIVCFYTVAFLGYDVFHSPYMNILPKTIVMIPVLIGFNYFVNRIYSNKKDWKKIAKYASIISIFLWFLYNMPMLSDYTQRKGFEHFMSRYVNIVILLEWIELIIIAYIYSYITYIKKYKRKKKKINPEILDDMA